MPRQPKTREELVQAYYRNYSRLKQYRDKLISGEMTKEEILVIAEEKADRELERQMDRLRGYVQTHGDLMTEISEFRVAQEKKYRSEYQWNDSNDEATLSHILDVECVLYEIRKRLEDKTTKNESRQKLFDQQKAHAALHKDLLSAAGIDRLTRDKKKETNQPYEDWMEIKRQAAQKMKDLASEFVPAMNTVADETTMRDLVKYHLGYPFEIVDALLSNHRRVLGMSMRIERPGND